MIFSLIKCKRNENVGMPSLRKNGTMKNVGKAKAQILNYQFNSAFSIDDQKTQEIKSPHAANVDDIAVTTDGAEKLLDDLNLYKANGPDRISARMLKETSNEITKVMMIFLKLLLPRVIYPIPGERPWYYHCLNERKKIATKLKTTDL